MPITVSGKCININQIRKALQSNGKVLPLQVQKKPLQDKLQIIKKNGPIKADQNVLKLSLNPCETKESS